MIDKSKNDNQPRGKSKSQMTQYKMSRFNQPEVASKPGSLERKEIQSNQVPAATDYMKNLTLQDPHKTNQKLQEIKKSMETEGHVVPLAGVFRGMKGHAPRLPSKDKLKIGTDQLLQNQMLPPAPTQISFQQKTLIPLSSEIVNFQSARERFNNSGRQRIAFGNHGPRFAPVNFKNQINSVRQAY